MWRSCRCQLAGFSRINVLFALRSWATVLIRFSLSYSTIIIVCRLYACVSTLPRGYNVVAISGPDAPDLTCNTDTPADSEILQRRADLRKDTQVYGLFDGCDAVIHLAALPKPWEPWRDVYENNVLIDHHVFEEAVRVALPRSAS